jgi:hypothetical protein
MAAHTVALLAATSPEPAAFLPDYVASRVEDSEANRFVPGNLDEVGAIGLDGRGAE